ncbi:CBM35 domain-containing protein [Streptomyces sp. NPDC001401]|uniref:CBM35 domain-containing protein n=1 Tax=Streptomyces sp. NPDC001401 TaxID=3364570 RepID=UPI0036CCA6E2
MTSGNNGASTPEDDDPFGYLYADGQANGAQPPSGGGGYGYPGSVNRVRAVGQRQYGQQPPQAQQTAAYGQVPQQQGVYGQPNAAYQAPETFPGGAPTTQQPMPAGGGRGRGPNTKGLLIGAVAVVAAVVIGIGVAMMNGNSDNKASGGSSSTPSTSQSSEPSQSASSSASADLPKTDAKALTLGTGVTTASDVKGAQADGGVYVTGFNQVGASVTWTVNGIEKAGTYRLYVRYALPDADANATLTVNTKPNTQPLNMKNFGKLPKNGWQTTWGQVSLNKGTNTIQLSCQQGNQCNALLDQFYVTENADQ